ncbi:MAG: hypothetical protein K6356_03205, partial [Chloroflexus sp.]
MQSRRWYLWLVVILVTLVPILAFMTLRRGQAEEGGPILQYPPEPPAPTIGPNPTVPAHLATGPLFVADFATADSLRDWQL